MKIFLLYLFLLINVFSNFVTAEIILPADIVEGQDSNKSWIKNSHFEKNVNSVSSYADAAGTSPVDGTGGASTITCTRTTSSPISGDGSLLITKDAANRQGQGCSIPFTIDRGDRSTMQAIVLPYEVASGTFTAGTDSTNSDLVMWVYDVTNSVLIPVQGTGRFYSNTADYFFGYFQTNSNSTSYRLIFHQALTGTSAYTLKVDNIKIFKSKFSVGTIISDWVSWTPTGSWVSNATYTGRWRQIGDEREYDVQVATTGAPTSASLTINLPSGHTIDTAKIATTTNKKIGWGTIHDNGTDEYEATVFYSSTTAVAARVLKKSAGNDYVDLPSVNATQPMTWANTDSINLQWKVPIIGLSSGTQISDGYLARDISFSTNTSTTSATTSAPFIYTNILSNQSNMYNSSTGVATALSSGTYCFIATAYNAGNHSINFYKNSSSLTQGATLGTAANSSQVTWCGPMNSGDTIEVRPNSSVTAGGEATLNTFSGFKISSSQTISMATKFAFQGRGVTSSSVGSNTVVKYSTITEDTHGCWNATNGDCTVPYSATYGIICSSRITTGGTASVNQYMDAKVQVEAATVSEFANYVQNTGVGAWSATSHWQGPMVAGQKARCLADTNITSPQITTGVNHTYMIMYMVK
jgi:hypothetical protein